MHCVNSWIPELLCSQDQTNQDQTRWCIDVHNISEKAVNTKSENQFKSF